MVGVPKHPNEFNLTRLCIARVLDAATPEEIAKLCTEQAGLKDNLWRYKKGLRALRWREQGGLVDRLDAQFPGSAAVFRSPVGQVLLGKKFSKSEAIEAIRGLGDPRRTIILGAGYLANYEGQSRRSLGNVFDELERFDYPNTIDSIVLMLAWADSIQNHETWNAICRFYRRMIPQMICSPAVPHFDILFDAVDAIALFRDFAANERRDRHRSWKLEHRAVRKLRKENAREIMVSWNKWNGVTANPSLPHSRRTGRDINRAYSEEQHDPPKLGARD